MADHYHDPADLKRLRDMKQLAPTEFQAWAGLDKIVGREDGAIPHKYRELVAIAVALTTQCPYCIEVHAKSAKKAGATREELAEVTFIAAALRAGAAATHGLMALKLYEQD
jgi:AhpD family alkylhydroperoxidase